MARLCVQLTANNHPTNSALNPFRTHTGDVVCVAEDGHVWSPAELKCGQYQFVDVVGVPASTYDNLVASTLDVNGFVTAIRANTLTLATIDAAAIITKGIYVVPAATITSAISVKSMAVVG